MTERFKKAVHHVLEHEGGYNDIKADRGGATNWGVSLRFLKTLGKGGDLDGDGDVDWMDVSKLTKAEAMQIYYDNFWRPLYERMPERLAAKTFDTAVNTGHARAHILLQQTLCYLGSKIPCDGVIGPVTLSECAKFPEALLLQTYCVKQLAFYREIIAKKPDQVKFINGWTNRAKWVPQVSVPTKKAA